LWSVMSYVLRPDPVSPLSSKRQRLEECDEDRLSISALSALPREIKSHGGLGAGCSGIASVRGRRVSRHVAWAKVQNHVYFWEVTDDKQYATPSCSRLSVPQNVASAQAWSLCAFESYVENQVGVLLVSDRGDILCWQNVSKRTIPIEHSLQLGAYENSENPELVSVVKGISTSCSDEDQDITRTFVVGTSHGNVFVVWISPEDFCIRFKQVLDSRARTGPGNDNSNSGVGGMFGRWLGIGGGSNEESPQDVEEFSEQVVDLVFVVSPHDQKRTSGMIFILLASGKIHRLDVCLVTMDVSCGWECNKVDGWISEKIRPQGEVRYTAIKWVFAGTDGGGWLALCVDTADGVSLHEIRNVTRSEPHLGGSSPVLGYPSRGLRDVHFAIQECTRQSVAFVAYEYNHKLTVAFVGFVCSSRLRDENNWKVETTDCSAEWLAIEPLGRAGAATDTSRGRDVSSVAILTPTLVLRVQVCVAVDGLSPSTQNDELRRSVPQMNQVSPRRGPVVTAPRSSMGGLDMETAKPVMRRIFRAYMQQVDMGRNGLLIAKEDNKWDDLLDSSLQVLHDAICFVCEKELDRSPNQRWADKWSSDKASDAQNSNFAPQLINRHLISKKGRFGSPGGFLGFLESAGIVDRLERRTIDAIIGYDYKLLACGRLCELQSRAPRSKGGKDVLKILKPHMRSIVIERERCRKRGNFDEEKYIHGIELCGLSVSDIFYSEVSQIDSFLIYLVEAIENEGLVLENDAVQAFNSIVLAIMQKHEVEYDSLRAADSGTVRATTWRDSPKILDALQKTIYRSFKKLDELTSPLWKTKRSMGTVDLEMLGSTVGQVRQIVDIFLGGKRSYGELEQGLSYEMIAPFVEYARLFLNRLNSGIENSAEITIYEECVRFATELSVDFVCHEGLFHVSELGQESDGTDYLKKFLDQSVVASLKLQDCPETNGGYKQIVSKAGNILTVDTGRNTYSLWKLRRRVVGRAVGTGEDTVRWNFEAEDGSLLSFTGDNFCLKEGHEDAGYKEMFEVLHGDAYGTGGIMTSENQDCVHILAWDKVTCLGVDRTELGTPVKVSYIGEWCGLPSAVFENYLKKQNSARILHLVEDGSLDADLDKFLKNKFTEMDEDSLGNETQKTLYDLKWMHTLRRQEYVQCAETLYVETQQQKQSRSQIETELSIAKLSLLASERPEVEMSGSMRSIGHRLAALQTVKSMFGDDVGSLPRLEKVIKACSREGKYFDGLQYLAFTDAPNLNQERLRIWGDVVSSDWDRRWSKIIKMHGGSSAEGAMKKTKLYQVAKDLAKTHSISTKEKESLELRKLMKEDIDHVVNSCNGRDQKYDAIFSKCIIQALNLVG